MIISAKSSGTSNTLRDSIDGRVSWSGGAATIIESIGQFEVMAMI
ncbi:hypothetical protein N8664_02910 [Verrucomicrobia bacterium]|nr:hypothetical protein [Verrucomicrobiota bacterium]